MLEGQYGDLIAKRSELKGISKKPELLATKKEIAVRITIKRFLKLSKAVDQAVQDAMSELQLQVNSVQIESKENNVFKEIQVDEEKDNDDNIEDAKKWAKKQKQSIIRE